MTFLQLDRTYGWTSIPKDITQIPFTQVNFSNYGIFTLTAAGLNNFKNKLDADNTLALQFMAAKLGFDPNNSTEYEKAIKLYQAQHLVSATTLNTYNYVCQMHFNKNAAELDQCIANKTAPAAHSSSHTASVASDSIEAAIFTNFLQ